MRRATATSRSHVPQEGASVVASDISPGMVERGRARAAAEGYDIEWLEADAEELPFEDERFDCVGSVFGAMIAPRPERAAPSCSGWCGPGGTVGMTAWRSDSLVPKIGELSRQLLARWPAGPLAGGMGGGGDRAGRASTGSPRASTSRSAR